MSPAGKNTEDSTTKIGVANTTVKANNNEGQSLNRNSLGLGDRLLPSFTKLILSAHS
jgi:hypothetical protein